MFSVQKIFVAGDTWVIIIQRILKPLFASVLGELAVSGWI
jgi:hypothetical protein